jgi:hypothetical protein
MGLVEGKGEGGGPVDVPVGKQNRGWWPRLLDWDALGITDDLRVSDPWEDAGGSVWVTITAPAWPDGQTVHLRIDQEPSVMPLDLWPVAE